MQAHTQRVRLQAVSIGRTAYARQTNNTIEELTALVERALHIGPTHAPSLGPSWGRARMAQPQERRYRRHTTVIPELARTSAVRLVGPRREGRMHIDEIVRELRHRHGHWRELDIDLPNGAKTHL